MQIVSTLVRRRRITFITGGGGGGGSGPLYPAAPFTTPHNTVLNTSTNKLEGTPLNIKYSTGTPIASWVNLETDTSKGTLSASDFAGNLAILQAWIDADAATNTRRGYEYNADRIFEGHLVLKRNTGAGWTGFRPIGYVYNAGLKTPRKVSTGVPIIRANSANVPAVETNTSGTTDAHLGRYAFFGHHISVISTLGATVDSFTNGIVKLGHYGAFQNTLAKIPAGFLFHDCTIWGVARRYFRRGVESHCNDLELRACCIHEIHNSYTDGTGGIVRDAQCLIGWNSEGRYEIAYTILHGGDECANLGGAGAAIPDLDDQCDVHFDHCEFSANDTYLFNASGVDGPHNLASNFRWLKKNCYEQKTGQRVFHSFCRYSGITIPNDNQGYAITIKTAPQGLVTPNQRSSDVHIHGGFVERCPALLACVAMDSPEFPGQSFGLPARRVSITDTFGYELSTGSYQQTNRKILFQIAGSLTNPLDSLHLSHISLLSSTTEGSLSTTFADPNSAPNLVLRDVLTTHGVYGIFSSTGSGNLALNSYTGTPVSWTCDRLTLVPRASVPGGYPAGTTAVASFAALGVVDFSSKNLRLAASSTYYKGGANASTDGWNRGVSDPEMVLTELAETPTFL